MPTKVDPPKIDTRPFQTYMGIHTITPIKGRFKVVDHLRKEMNQSIKDNNIETT